MIKFAAILIIPALCQLEVSFIGSWFNISEYNSGYYAGILSTTCIVFILSGVNQ